MPLIDILLIEVGSSVAKSILKNWLKLDVASGASSQLIDLLKTRIEDRVTQQQVARQLQAIGEKVGESLLPIFKSEGTELDEQSQIAVALAVAETLNITSSRILAELVLDPSKLAEYLLESRPANIYHFNEAEAALYQRIITGSCAFIIDIASALPRFTTDIFSVVLQREGQLLEMAKVTLSEVQRIRASIDPHEESINFEIRYHQAIVRQLGDLQLFGADVSSTSKRQRLNVAYVTLSVQRRPSRITHSTDTEDKITGRNLAVDDVLVDSRRLFIHGSAGSGKTTLLQWVAVNSASHSFKGILERWNDTIPFYVRLRECVEAGLPAPENFPTFITKAIINEMPKGWVREKLASRKAVVLIDGIDEVPLPKREEVRIWLKDLIGAFPNARYIITSRPHAVEKDWINDQGFVNAELQPMDLHDIRTFIDNWHAAIAEEYYDAQEKSELLAYCEHLKEEVEYNRSNRNLATNPLLCAMLCALNRERHKRLPSDRIELYEACCKLLIDRRDEERGVSLFDYPAKFLTYRQRRLLLEDLAYWFIKNGWSEVEVHRVDEYLSRKLASLHNLQQSISGADVRRFCVERTNIIREPTIGYIDFTHRTFQEFLAAQAAVNEGDIGLLVKNAHNDQWAEVIILACGLARDKEYEQLIKGIMIRGDQEKDHQYQLYLLSLSCLETPPILSPSIKVEIEKRLKIIGPPQDITEARALAFAGEKAIKYLVKNDQNADTTAAACVHALARIGENQALDVLEEYVNVSSQVVIDELWKAWDAFDGEIYVNRILTKVLERNPAPPKHLYSLEKFQYFTELTKLDLSQCSRITDIKPLTQLNQLNSLNLSSCWHLTDISPLANLKQLKMLDLSNCQGISDLLPLASLIHLTSLNLANCSEISSLKPLADLAQLVLLNISGCKQIANLDLLVSMNLLTSLDISKCNEIMNLRPLASLIHLTSLNLANCSGISSLFALGKLFQLAHLNISNCEQIDDFSPLAKLTRLTSLNIAYNTQFSDLNLLNSLKDLTNLDISGCKGISSIEPLSNLSKLSSISLVGCEKINDLRPLSNLSQLFKLNLANCEQVDNLEPLSNLTQLVSLDLSRCKQIRDLQPLKNLKQLTSLSLWGCELVNDLSPLAKLTHLALLDLTHCEGLYDLNPLKDLKTLKEVRI